MKTTGFQNMIYFITSSLQNIPISTAPCYIAVIKRNTVGCEIESLEVNVCIGEL